MPIRDVLAQNASLDNDYGPNHGPASPDDYDCALFNGDPMITDGLGLLLAIVGVEVTGPGYARATIPMADWPDADGGSKTATATFPAPTDEWDRATHWALFDGATMWDCGPLEQALLVTGAGPPPLVNVQIFHPDSRTNEL